MDGYSIEDGSGCGGDRERRIELLIRRLPLALQPTVRWLRRPAARWVRIPTGILLMAGSVLALQPVFGLWMLPLGLLFLAEDLPPVRRLTGRLLCWVEARHPRWMGLSPPH